MGTVQVEIKTGIPSMRRKRGGGVRILLTGMGEKHPASFARNYGISSFLAGPG